LLDSHAEVQERSFRIFRPDTEKNDGTLAVDSRDPLEHLYANDLLFSFMCSAAKTTGASIEGEAELRIAAAGDRSNQSPKVLWNKELTKLADTFHSRGFGPDQEALINIIVPLSMAEILQFPHPLIESMRAEVAKAHELKDATRAVDIYKILLKQAECYASGKGGFYEFTLALLLEAQNDAACQAGVRRLDDGRIVHTFMTNLSYWLQSCISDSVGKSEVEPRFFSEFQRLFRMSGRRLSIELPTATRRDDAEHNDSDGDDRSNPKPFPSYFKLTESHLHAMRKVNPARLSPEAAKDRDYYGRVPLHYAAMADRSYLLLLWESLKTAIEHVGINAKDYRGYTPLHYACACNRSGACRILLNHGAKLSSQGIDGMYPMHLAAREGHVAVIEVFRRFLDRYPAAKSTIKRDDNGFLPIHWGAINGHPGVIQQLKEDINVGNADGRTSLHLAAIHKKDDVIQKLIELSADLNKTDMDGHTAAFLAQRLKNQEILEKLVQAGAKRPVITVDASKAPRRAFLFDFVATRREIKVQQQ
jgi:hypothetical protein